MTKPTERPTESARNFTAPDVNVIYFATWEPPPSWLVRLYYRASAFVNAYCMAVVNALHAIADAWKGSADV